MTDGTCQRWFAKFHAGDFSLDDAPRLGRRVEVDSDPIEILNENSQCSTMWEGADILKISKSVKLLVKIKICLLFYGKAHTDFLANPINAKIISLLFPLKWKQMKNRSRGPTSQWSFFVFCTLCSGHGASPGSLITWSPRRARRWDRGELYLPPPCSSLCSILKFYTFSSLILPFPPAIPTLWCVSVSTFSFFAQSFHPLTTPSTGCHLLCTCETISILLVSSVCSLDSTLRVKAHGTCLSLAGLLHAA